MERLYGAGTTESKAEPKERGADLMVEYSDPLGTPQTVAIQVKAYFGEPRVPELKHALAQIKQAHESYEGLTSGIVFTLLDRLPDELSCAPDDLQLQLGIPVRLLTRNDAAQLFLRHLPELFADDE